MKSNRDKLNTLIKVNNISKQKTAVVPNNKSAVVPNNKPAVVPTPNNKPAVVANNKPVVVPNNKPVVVPTPNNKPVIQQPNNNMVPSFTNKLGTIFSATDLVSNIIKLCIMIIVILFAFILGNMALKLSGNLRDSVLYLLGAIIVFSIGEVGLSKLLGDSLPIQITSVILFGLGTLLCLISSKKLFDYFKNAKIESPWIVQGTKGARNSMVIPQDPKNPDTVILYRSNNEEDGIEFTYSFWMIIDNYGYKNNEWKHIMHKGDKNASPNMCPGFWLHPSENTMRIYFNTMKNIKEHVDIKDMPLKKWVNVAMTIKQRILYVYINGNLKRRHELSSVPRQNYGDLWVNLFGGFDGFLSKIRYHRRALEPSEVEKLISDGPSKSACIDSGSIPPYLDDDWWLKRD